MKPLEDKNNLYLLTIFKLYHFLEFITPSTEALKARSIYLSILLKIFQRGGTGVQGSRDCR